MTDDLKAAAVQLARDNGAPEDVGDYIWIAAAPGGEAFTGVFSGPSESYVPLDVSKVFTYGTRARYLHIRKAPLVQVTAGLRFTKWSM